MLVPEQQDIVAPAVVAAVLASIAVADEVSPGSVLPTRPGLRGLGLRGLGLRGLGLRGLVLPGLSLPVLGLQKLSLPGLPILGRPGPGPRGLFLS